MNPLRESYLITENEHNFDSLFAKINLYNYQRVHSRGRLNESRFNAKNDIRLTLSEQQCVKDFFKIVEYKMLQSYENRMNEGIDFNIGAKVKKIKQFFEALSKMVIGTVSEFINKIIEMLNKLGQKYRNSSTVFLVLTVSTISSLKTKEVFSKASIPNSLGS